METHTEEAVRRWRQSDVATSPGAPRTAGSTRSALGQILHQSCRKEAALQTP